MSDPFFGLYSCVNLFSPQSTNKNPSNSLDFFESSIFPLFHFTNPTRRFNIIEISKLPLNFFSLVNNLPRKFQIARLDAKLTCYHIYLKIDRYSGHDLTVIYIAMYVYLTHRFSLWRALDALAQLFGTDWVLTTTTTHDFNMCYPTTNLPLVC